MDEDFDRSDWQAPPRKAADRSVTYGDRVRFGRGPLYSRKGPVPGGPQGRRSVEGWGWLWGLSRRPARELGPYSQSTTIAPSELTWYSYSVPM